MLETWQNCATGQSPFQFPGQISFTKTRTGAFRELITSTLFPVKCQLHFCNAVRNFIQLELECMLGIVSIHLHSYVCEKLILHVKNIISHFTIYQSFPFT